jgi:adenylate cyclase
VWLCGTELPLNSKFCNECGAPVTQVSRSAEYKQVTGAIRRCRSFDGHRRDCRCRAAAQIMTELLDRSKAVLKRYGGTLSQFTGDGIMAVFGVPITLEDHAVRACLAAPLQFPAVKYAVHRNS